MASLQRKSSRGYTYWQIVESRRVNGKPRPIVLLHLGTAESLLRRLSDSPAQPVKARVLQFGAVAAVWNLATELDVVGIIDRHVPKRAQGMSCGQYMLLAAINRCVHPTSKASLYDWYRTTVLHRLLPASQRQLSSQRFWDHMGYLDEEAIAECEAELLRRVLDNYHIGLQTLIFDATNFDTYIDTQTASTLPQRGHAKSKRADLRLLGLALLVSTDHHIPLLSYLYAGNQNDSRTFSQVAEKLAQRYQQLAQDCEDITLVFDGGNTSKANIAKVDRGPFHFITSLTVTHHQDLLEVSDSRYDSFADERLAGTTAYRTHKLLWTEQRTVVVTRSQELLRGQIAGIRVSLRKRRRRLRELRAKLLRSQRRASGGRALYTRQSILNHLQEATRGQYINQILKTELLEEQGRLDFRFWTDQAAYAEVKRTRLGKRILCTDKHEWTTEQIILASRAQYHIEDAFRQMKDPHWAAFSPVFHWTDQKLRVHAFYCVLALLLSSLLQHKVAQAGLKISINALFEQLSAIREVVNLYASARTRGTGRLRAEYVLSDCSPLQEKLCSILELHRLVRT
jgi:transposase